MSYKIDLSELERDGATSLTQQLVDRFVAAIEAGELEPGEKLPPTRELAELVGERGQLAELQHIIRRHARCPEPLASGSRYRVRGRRDLLLAEIEDRVDDRLALEVPRDVHVLSLHAPTTVSATRRYVVT